MNAYEMTNDEFIEKHRDRFMKYEGKQNIVGVQSLDGYSIYSMPKDSQKRGKLIKSVETILTEIHMSILKGRINSYLNGLLPNALWFEKNIKPIDEKILKDYPELLEKQNRILSYQ